VVRLQHAATCAIADDIFSHPRRVGADRAAFASSEDGALPAAGRAGSIAVMQRMTLLWLGLLLSCPVYVGCGDDDSDRDGGPLVDGAPADGTSIPDGSSTPDGISPVPSAFARVWTHAAETSALVYWQMSDIAESARSYVEYGESAAYGMATPTTAGPRQAHLHRITGLRPDTPYHYRMVLVTDGGEIRSDDGTFMTITFAEAVRIPAEVPGPPYTLDRDDALYVLTEDVSAAGTTIEVSGANVTLELDGHTVTFGTSSPEQVRGIYVTGSGRAVVRNGHVVQGAAAADYSVAVETRWRAEPIEVFGITTDVSRPNAYPLRLFGAATDAEIHHNHLFSTVTEIESRHYPGNHLLRIDVNGSNISVHDNILTEGTHGGLYVGTDSGASGDNIEVAYNDIRHHARYVNGYALSGGAPGGAAFHHNRVTSMGRGVHLTRPNTELHDNYLDIRGHMTLDDYPAGSRPWVERRVELHGIKLEGTEVTGARVYNNYMRIVQYLPDADWDYVPATPLNVASYDPNAGNEVFDNTFIALTEYADTHHAPYGEPAQWASSIYFVDMTAGPAASGGYSVYIHGNRFYSNDLFVSAGTVPDMTIRIEDNTFTLATDPPPTNGRMAFQNIGALEAAILAGGNVFVGTSP